MHQQLEALLAVYNEAKTPQAEVWFLDLHGVKEGELEVVGPMNYRSACYVSGLLLHMRSVREINLRASTKKTVAGVSCVAEML